MTEPSLPFSDPGFFQLSVDEQIAECNAWLDNNPGAAQWRRETVREFAATKTKLAEAETGWAESKTELGKRSLSTVRKEFPALMDRTISAPHFPENHNHAEVMLDDSYLGNVLPTINDWMDNHFWGVHFAGVEHPDCDDEINAQQLIVSLLQSVLRALKLNTVIQVVQNRTLAGVECDVLLLYKPNRLPFAVIEAKKPGNSSESRRIVFEGKVPEELKEEGKKAGKRQKRERENKVAGQVLAEMMAIELFGFPQVFGMVSTGNHWRLVSTGAFDTEADASALKPEAARPRLEILTASHDDIDNINQERSNESISVSPHQRRIEFTKTHTQCTEEKHTVYASRILPELRLESEEKAVRAEVKESGEDIVRMVTLFVLKSCMTLIDLLKNKRHPTDKLLIRPRMACRVLTSEEQAFAFGTVNPETLELENFNPKLQTIHVIHHLGTGEHGNCCLGISEKGSSSCAVKFFHKTQNEQAQQEFQHWKAVYGSQKVLPMSRILKNAGGDCLVMPYLCPIGKEERCQFLEEGRIAEALYEFVESGYIHNDIKWRHFGLWESKVFLLDLGDIKEVENADEIKTWHKNAMSYLRQSAGNVTVKTPTRPQPDTTMVPKRT